MRDAESAQIGKVEPANVCWARAMGDELYSHFSRRTAAATFRGISSMPAFPTPSTTNEEDIFGFVAEEIGAMQTGTYQEGEFVFVRRGRTFAAPIRK